MKKILVGLWLAVIAFSASAQGNCTVSPESCMTAPIAKACPAGKKWSTAGSGIAHCVSADPACASGEKVAYDTLGNPSCVARCTSSDFWDGSVCRPCTTTSAVSGACPSGYDGTAYKNVTTNTCAGSTIDGSWDYSSCTAACRSHMWGESQACPGGGSALMSRVNTTDSCTGTTYGAWNTNACKGACKNVLQTESGSCQANYTGTAYRTNIVNSCTGSITQGTWDYSGCTFSPAVAQCPPRETYCYGGSAQSNDPRDAWYTYGYVVYEGPSCERVDYLVGQVSEYDGGCPPGYDYAGWAPWN